MSTRNIEILRSEREHLEARLRREVGRARARGVSWAAIGRALGVSKQAASQTFRGVRRRP